MKIISPVSSVYSLNECIHNYRNDPHFNNEYYYNIRIKIEKISNFKISDFFSILRGISPSGEYEHVGVLYIRIQDLEPLGIDLDNTAKIDPENLDGNENFIQKYDILLAVTGATIGKVSLYLDDIPTICTSDILILRPKPNFESQDIFGIYSLLLTDSYKRIIKKGITGASNQHLSPNYVEQIPIILNDNVLGIGNQIEEALNIKNESRLTNKEISNLFKDKIGNISIKREISHIYNLDKVKKVERIDPKFLAKKIIIYEEELIKNWKTSSLKELCKNDIRRGTQPDSEEVGEIHVIKTRDVNDRPVIWESTEKTTDFFYSSNEKAQIPENALIITSTGEGAWGRTSVCTKKALGDGHITILEIDSSQIDPFYTCAFLWTKYGKSQYERRVRGCTGQTEIYPRDIKNIIIPRLGSEFEENITEKMKEFFNDFYNSLKIYNEAVNNLNDVLK